MKASSSPALSVQEIVVGWQPGIVTKTLSSSIFTGFVATTVTNTPANVGNIKVPIS